MVKNLLLFAGIIFAAELDDPHVGSRHRRVRRLLCRVQRRIPAQRHPRRRQPIGVHPVKRRRPIARGELRPTTALVLACALASAQWRSRPGSAPASLACLLGFAVLQAAYTLRLKHVVFVDVVVIAGLFVIRAVAGAVAVDVRISPWLLVCTGLLALFLALGKRRAELVLVGAEPRPGAACSRATRSGSSTSCSPRSPAQRGRRTRCTRDGPRLVRARRHGAVRRLRPRPLPAAAAPTRRRGGARERPRSATCRSSLTVAIWAVAVRSDPRRAHNRSGDAAGCRAPTTQRRRDRAATRSRRSRLARSARDAGRHPASPTRQSTSRVRSSRRAFRSAISSCSSRSSRLIALLSSPLISPRFRATGSTSRRRPSCTASPTRSGSAVSSVERRGAERLDFLARAPQGRFEPTFFVAALAGRRRCASSPVSSACSSMGARLLWPSDEIGRARLRPAAGADRPASGRAARRLAAARLRARATGAVRHRTFAELPDELDGELVVVNDTRVVPARLLLRRETGGEAEVLLRRDARRRRLGGARASLAAAAGRRAARAGRAARAARRGTLADPARRASRTASRRCRRTSPSRSPSRAATRPSTRPRPALLRHRRPASTSRLSCSPGSTSSG